jgi:hypothetical protein
MHLIPRAPNMSPGGAAADGTMTPIPSPSSIQKAIHTWVRWQALQAGRWLEVGSPIAGHQATGTLCRGVRIRDRRAAAARDSGW